MRSQLWMYNDHHHNDVDTDCGYDSEADRDIS